MTRFRKLLTTSFLLLSAVLTLSRSDAKRLIQALPTTVNNLETAKAIEIKDSGGFAIVRGSFTKASEKRSEIELTATLSTTGTNPTANGKAEIEIEKRDQSASKQKLEITLKNIPPRANYKVFVDGNELAAFTTDKSGKAELKLTSEP